MSIDVSIIIVNFNTVQLTLDCIESIYKHTKDINFEIIIVDNASTDGSKEIFEQDCRIQYIYLNQNFGFGYANNIGVKNSSGEYIFLLNSDTLLTNNALTYFISYIKKNKEAGVLGAYLLNKQNQQIHSYGSFITIRSELRLSLRKYLEKLHLYNRSKQRTKPIIPIKVDYITGADLFMEKSLYNRIDGFDENFFMYCEEVDLQDRIKDIGYQRIIIPGPQIIHLEGSSDNYKKKIWSTKKYHNILVSKNYYLQKRNSKGKMILFKILNTIILLPGIIARKESIRNKLTLIKGAIGWSQPIKE